MQGVWPPPPPPPPGYQWAPPRLGGPVRASEPHPTFPFSVAVGAVVVLAASLALSRVVLDAVVDQRWPIAAYVALTAMLGYGPVLAWSVVATGRVSDAPWQERLGLRFRPADVGWAPVVWFAAVGAEIVVASIILALRIPISSNTEGVDELSADRAYVLSLLVLAVVAAPIAEEIAFRAVVLRGLLSRVGPVAAIAIQAVLFGLAHIDPVRGAGNIGLAMITAAIGATFGAAAYWLRRIGVTIAAHAILNGVVLIIVLSGVLDNVGNS